jgi:Tol biopolymer transport system component
MPGSKSSPLNISSDFGQIMFSIQLDNGKEDLYTVPVSSDEAKITGPSVKFFTKNQREDSFILSADGKKLASVREGKIWIVNTNGGDSILVTDLQESVENVRWTIDSKSLLFSTSSGWSFVENPGSLGNIIKLSDEGKAIECRRWNIYISPDKSKVAVLTDQQIKLIPVDGTKSGRILNISNLELKGCFELCWSPDGKSLAFIGTKEMEDKVSYPDGKFLIYNIPVDSGIPVRVAPDDDDIKFFLSWSPDSKWIAYSTNRTVKIRPESTIWEADFDEVKEKLAK